MSPTARDLDLDLDLYIGSQPFLPEEHGYWSDSTRGREPYRQTDPDSTDAETFIDQPPEPEHPRAAI